MRHDLKERGRLFVPHPLQEIIFVNDSYMTATSIYNAHSENRGRKSNEGSWCQTRAGRIEVQSPR